MRDRKDRTGLGRGLLLLAFSLALTAPGQAASGKAAPAKAAPARPTPADAATVIIQVEKAENADGEINVALCNQSLSVEGCPYTGKGPASTKPVEIKLENIPPGKYAAVAYHDENANGVFDRLLGIPQEAYAISNIEESTLVPRFQDALVTVKAGENKIVLRLHKFLR